jgi:hypothetical protein
VYRCGYRRCGPLAVQPRVDIPFAEPPLATHSNSRNLAGLDQAVDGAQVDLEVLENLFSRQENVIVSEVSGQNLAILQHGGPIRMGLSGSVGRTYAL